MSKKILVVDDETEVRRAVRLLLEEDQHSVVEANNGAEALGLFRKEGFDLVMTDQCMPHVTGAELAVQIRELAPSQPIVMLTAYPRKPGPDNPVDAVIPKPHGLRDLRQRLARLLDATSQNN
jgi:CheY-like chemotaxis protein